MRTIKTHIPSHDGEMSEDNFYYHREEREQLPNYRPPKTPNPYRRFIILAIDLVLLFFVFQCVRNRIISKHGSQAVYPGESQVATVRGAFRYSLTIDRDQGGGEVRFSIRHTNDTLFALEQGTRLEFLCETGNRTQRKAGKIMDASQKRIVHVFHAPLSKRDVESLKRIEARYLPRQPEQSLSLVLTPAGTSSDQ